MTRPTDDLLRIELRGDVAVLWIDVPGAEVNTLREGFDRALADALDKLEGTTGLTGVVLASAKESSFVAGADLELLRGLDDAEQASALARAAQRGMNRVAGFPRPVVAAIHGACLGGGLELALACSGRIATDHDDTRLGLPEVTLGVIPGAGGTQRLPRLVGLETALELILKGGRLPPGAARSKGLVDQVVHPAVLLDVAIERARRLGQQPTDDSQEPLAGGRKALADLAGGDIKALLLEDNPAGRAVLFSQSRSQAVEATGGNMPAPLEAIEVIRVGVEKGFEAGLEAEAAAFGRLAVSAEARNLMRMFFFRQELKKESWADAEPREIRKVGVVGAGLMGGGIARVTAEEAGLTVRMKDIDHGPLREALRTIRSALDHDVARHRLDPHRRDRIMARLRPTTGSTGFGRADVVIEAVVEDLGVKHGVLGEIEEAGGDSTVFASNTSSIPIGRIAEGAASPERVAGMHYFSPVDKVPLLEVVRAEGTAPWVVATCVELGRRQDKTVIVVEDGVGFYTSRILGPYVNEAAWLLSEGVPVEAVDDALAGFGFPVGPLKLLDEVGIDIAEKIGRILHDGFGDRMAPCPVQQKLLDDDRKGRKNGRGFYRYERAGDGFERADGADGSLWEAIGVEPTRAPPSEQALALRCVLPMVAEAVRCLDEGIVRSARDADVGAVFGLGFPPFLGGPLRWIDERGAGRTVEELDRHREQLGDRFAVPDRLRRMADDGEPFHSGAGS